MVHTSLNLTVNWTNICILWQGRLVYVVKIETMATLMIECEGLVAQQKLIKVMKVLKSFSLYISHIQCCWLPSQRETNKEPWKQSLRHPQKTRFAISKCCSFHCLSCSGSPKLHDKATSLCSLSWTTFLDLKFVRLPGQTWVDPHGHGERGIVDSDWRPVKVMVMVVVVD